MFNQGTVQLQKKIGIKNPWGSVDPQPLPK